MTSDYMAVLFITGCLSWCQLLIKPDPLFALVQIETPGFYLHHVVEAD